MSMLCLQNARALSSEHSCCQQNIRALSTERPCSIRRTSELCPWNSVLCLCISVLSAAYPHSDWLTKSPIVVAKKTIILQVANHSCRQEDSQRFQIIMLVAQIHKTWSADPSQWFHRLFMKCLQTLHEVPRTLHKVSADSSCSVCKLFMRYRGLFMRCLQTLYEVCADASWITVLCHAQFRGLPMR